MNIGNVLDDMGTPEEALVELKKGLDVLVSVHGQEHLHVAASCQNIAGVYMKQGKRAQAIEMATTVSTSRCWDLITPAQCN